MLVNEILNSLEEFQKMYDEILDIMNPKVSIEKKYLLQEIKDYLKIIKLYSLMLKEKDIESLNKMNIQIISNYKYLTNKIEILEINKNERINKKPLLNIDFNFNSINKQKILEYKMCIQKQINYLNKYYTNNINSLKMRKELSNLKIKLNKLSLTNHNISINNTFCNNQNLNRYKNIIKNKKNDNNLIESLYLVEKKFTFFYEN